MFASGDCVVIALEPYDRGLLGTTLRYPYEVRDAADYFAELPEIARAEVRRDHAKAAEIWKSTDNMWWNGPDDPNVCVLKVRPITAELWDGPANAAVAAFEFAKARITGAKPNLGENRKVTVKM